MILKTANNAATSIKFHIKMKGQNNMYAYTIAFDHAVKLMVHENSPAGANHIPTKYPTKR
jgi:hypothetical protein